MRLIKTMDDWLYHKATNRPDWFDLGDAAGGIKAAQEWAARSKAKLFGSNEQPQQADDAGLGILSTHPTDQPHPAITTGSDSQGQR